MQFSFKKKQIKTPEAPLPKVDAEAENQTPKVFKKFLYPRKSRFTLLIGDEGVILLYMKGNTVISRQFVADASPSNLEELRETIVKDHLAPITMIIDSIDQSFVQQTLPPVSSLSVQKLIKRRLDRDFKPADIKGAIILGKEKDGRKDWNFLMISVEKSPQLVLWLDFVMAFPNRFRGIVLLSVEAAVFVRNLERSLGISAKVGTGSEWKILVSHNKVGGFRQIILRNGTLVFTRLALPVGDSKPEVIAGHIEQEMASTVEYLKRFGYNSRAGLDIYVLASEEVGKLVDVSRFEVKNFRAFSPHAIAQQLSIKGATQPTDQFGDVVLASVVGSIRKNILKLSTVESRLFDKYQLFRHGQRLMATFGVLALVIYGAYSGYAGLLARSAVADSEQKQRLGYQALLDIKKTINESKIDVDMASSQMELFRQIKSEARSPLFFVSQLLSIVKPPILLKSIHWKIAAPFPKEKVLADFANFNISSLPATKKGAAAPAPTAHDSADKSSEAGVIKEPVTVTLTVEFPPGMNSHAVFKKFTNDFLTKFHDAMPDFVLAYTTVPIEYLGSKDLQMSFDQQPTESSLGSKSVVVEISIYGMMQTAVGGENTP